MPFKLLNQKKAFETEAYEKLKPWETLTPYTGPKLEEFGAAPPEEKKEFVPVKFVSPFYRLDEEMKKRGFVKAKFTKYGYSRKTDRAWISRVEVGSNKGKWSAYYAAGGTSTSPMGGPFLATADEAVDDLLKIVDQPSYKDELEEKREKEEEEHEIVEGFNQPDHQIDGYRAGMSYWEHMFNEATNGEFYGGLAGKGFSVTSIKEFQKLLEKYHTPQALEAFAGMLANHKAFCEISAQLDVYPLDPKDVQLNNAAEKLLAEYHGRPHPTLEPLKEDPFVEVRKRLLETGWKVVEDLSSTSRLFIEEPAGRHSGMGIAGIERTAEGEWLTSYWNESIRGYTSGGRFLDLDAAASWLIAGIKSSRAPRDRLDRELRTRGFAFKNEYTGSITYARLAQGGGEQVADLAFFDDPTDPKKRRQMFAALWLPIPRGEYERAPAKKTYDEAITDLLAMIDKQQLKLSEEQHQAGVQSTIGPGVGVKEAITRLLGEYVARNENERRGGPMYHFDEKDLDDFMQRYWNEILAESKAIGPWQGQKVEPMGTWKEKWRSLVRRNFSAWQRDHYGVKAGETEPPPGLTITKTARPDVHGDKYVATLNGVEAGTLLTRERNPELGDCPEDLTCLELSLELNDQYKRQGIGTALLERFAADNEDEPIMLFITFVAEGQHPAWKQTVYRILDGFEIVQEEI